MRTINAHLTDYGRLKHFVHSILEKFMRKNSGQESQVQAHIHLVCESLEIALWFWASVSSFEASHVKRGQYNLFYWMAEYFVNL